MKFITVILLTGVFTCGQMTLDMSQTQYCILWEKLNKQEQTCHTRASDHTEIMMKMENQTDVIKTSLNQQHTAVTDVMKASLDQQHTALSDVMKTSLDLNQIALSDVMQTRFDQQTNLIIELMEKITDFQNETIQSNQDVTYQLEIQKLMLENQQLLHENKLLHQNNSMLANSLVEAKQGYVKEIQNLQNETRMLNESIQDVKESRDSLEEENQRLKNQIEELVNKTKNLNESMADVKESRDSLEDENQRLKSQIKNLLNKTKHLNESMADVKESRDSLEEGNQRLKSQIKNLVNETKNLNESMAGMIQSMAESKENYESEIQKLKQEVQILQNATQSMTESKQSCEKKIEKLKKEVQILQNVTSSMNKSLQESNQLTPSCNQPSGSGRWLSGGHRSSGTFSTIINKVKDTNQINHMYHFNRVSTLRKSVIADQLWVAAYGNNTIQVLRTTTVDRIKQITTTNYARRPWSLCSDSNGQVLLCSNTGLDVLSETGTHLYKVSGGHITDVHVGCNVAYVYNQTNNHVVTVVYHKGVWFLNNTFYASKSSKSDWNTLLVIEQTVYVGLYSSNTIQRYTLMGRYITQYGRRGSNTPGQLNGPIICGVDSQESVLVCDYINHRLQVLSAGGTWRVFTLPGIRYPYDVITDGRGNLWVSYYNGGYKITRFSV